MQKVNALLDINLVYFISVKKTICLLKHIYIYIYIYIYIQCQILVNNGYTNTDFGFALDKFLHNNKLRQINDNNNQI